MALRSGHLFVLNNNDGWGPLPLAASNLTPVPIETDVLNSSDRSSSVNRSEDRSDAENDTTWISNCKYDIFRKSDRIDRICDWVGIPDRRGMSSGGGIGAGGSRGQTMGGQGSGGPSIGSTNFGFIGEDDDAGFSLYDTSKLPKTGYARRGTGRYYNFQTGRGRYMNGRQQQQQGMISQAQTGGSQAILGQLKATKSLKNLERERERQIMKLRKQYGNRYEQKSQQNRARREPSIKIRSDWSVVEEVNFARLAKLSMSAPTGETLLFVGSLGYYDKSFDRISTKSERRLVMSNRIVHDVSTMDDPVIREMCRTGGKLPNGTSLSGPVGDVFMTDSIIASLMCCCRSVYPWDIIVTKIHDKLFFEKRANFDALTVSETSGDPPNDEEPSVNSPKNLSIEATLINANFAYQVLRRPAPGEPAAHYVYRLPDGDNPFIESGIVESAAFRYRRFDLGNNMRLVVRCRLDAVMKVSSADSVDRPETEKKSNKVEFMNIHAMNEWDSRCSNGIDWRSKLDTQRGAVLAAELKNNAFKLAKWTAASILADADQIKFGFVSRIHPKDPMHHVIRGVHAFGPSEFAKQMNLSMENAWAIVRWTVDFLAKQTDGKYVIVKDPAKTTIRIYKLPSESTIVADDLDAARKAEEEDAFGIAESEIGQATSLTVADGLGSVTSDLSARSSPVPKTDAVSSLAPTFDNVSNGDDGSAK